MAGIRHGNIKMKGNKIHNATLNLVHYVGASRLVARG